MEERPAYVPLSEGFFKAIRRLDPEQAYDLICLLHDYAFEGVEPDTSGAASAIFEVIRPGIDKAFENLRKKREAGRRRHDARPEGSTRQQTAAKPSTRQHTAAHGSTAQQTPEDREEVEVKTPSPKGGKGDARGTGDAPDPAPRGFLPPSLSDVAEYGEQFCNERGIPPGAFDAERFVDHFTSNGWKVSGRAPMKDWKSAVRNWIKRDNPNATKGGESDLFSAYA